MVGMKEKAIIEIQKDIVDEVTEEETKPVPTSSAVGSFSGITDKIKNAATKIATDTFNSIVSDITGKTATDKEILEVQFNPAELRISASSSESRAQRGIDKEHKQAAGGTLGIQVIVQIPLIFDISDKENNAVESNIRKKLDWEFNIADKVDAFIQSVKDPYLRNIRFSWGSLIYEGKLYSVDANYTMFNKDGSPIRASVNIQLLCRSEDGKSYWDTRCQQLLGKEA